VKTTREALDIELVGNIPPDQNHALGTFCGKNKNYNNQHI
jgi:hypothetical protein